MKLVAILLLAFIVAVYANGYQDSPPSDKFFHDGLKAYLDHVNGHVQKYFNNHDLNQSPFTYSSSHHHASDLGDAIKHGHGWLIKRDETKVLGKKANTEDDEEEAPAQANKAPTSQGKDAQAKNWDHDHHVRPPCDHDVFRVTIIDPIGDVVYDTIGPYYISNGNGYNSRPEVVQALINGEGFSARPIGDTFGYYFARVYHSDDHPSYHITVRVACMSPDQEGFGKKATMPVKITETEAKVEVNKSN